MPILITNYTWRQTQEVIILRIPIKGVSSKNADIFTSESYIKIHSPPFLFEVCLWQPVIDNESTCTIDTEETTFKLLKQTPEEWPALTANLTRQEALEVKKKAIDSAHEKAKHQLEEIKAKKNERQRQAVKEQISLSTQERTFIDHTREQERKAALAQMGWSSSVTITELPDEQCQISTHKKENKDIFKKNRNDNCSNLVPAPRATSQIYVSFTPRKFPTPSRESQVAEEKEWLSKQAEARRMTGFMAEELRPEEQDPVWLCDKGQSFYNVGNYLGAVSAYSHALTLNSKMYELHAGRAVAHLALANYNRALTDSSKALELLTPAVPQNEEARARCLLCRGSALAGLGLTKEAFGELKAASALRPQDSDIQTAISQLKIN